MKIKVLSLISLVKKKKIIKWKNGNFYNLPILIICLSIMKISILSFASDSSIILHMSRFLKDTTNHNIRPKHYNWCRHKCQKSDMKTEKLHLSKTEKL